MFDVQVILNVHAWLETQSSGSYVQVFGLRHSSDSCFDLLIESMFQIDSVLIRCFDYAGSYFDSDWRLGLDYD